MAVLLEPSWLVALESEFPPEPSDLGRWRCTTCDASVLFAERSSVVQRLVARLAERHFAECDGSVPDGAVA